MQHGNRAQDRHRGFAFGPLTGTRVRKAVVGVVGFAVAGVMLAACSSGSDNASSSSGGSGSRVLDDDLWSAGEHLDRQRGRDA